MARMSAGAELTAAHHAAQLAIRAGSIANLVRLWRIVDPTDLRNTIDVFVQAAVLLAGRLVEAAAGGSRAAPATTCRSGRASRARPRPSSRTSYAARPCAASSALAAVV